jgi:hypothetical protein
MFKINRGLLAGIATVAAMGLTFAGKPQLAHFVNDPVTIDQLMLLIGTVGSLVAGLLEGYKGKAVVNVEAAPVSRSAAVDALSAGTA